jgi:hypothetical protein
MNLNHGKLPAAELSLEFMTDVYSLCGTKEWTQLPNMIKQNKFESTVKSFGENLFDHTMYPIQFLSNLCKRLMNLGQCWSSAIIWKMVHLLFVIIVL